MMAGQSEMADRRFLITMYPKKMSEEDSDKFLENNDWNRAQNPCISWKIGHSRVVYLTVTERGTYIARTWTIYK